MQRGDTIDLISMPVNGLWRGRCQGRVGNFKFIYVETLKNGGSGSRSQSRGRRRCASSSSSGSSRKKEEEDEEEDEATEEDNGRPTTVEQLLRRNGLEVSCCF